MHVQIRAAELLLVLISALFVVLQVKVTQDMGNQQRNEYR